MCIRARARACNAPRQFPVPCAPPRAAAAPPIPGAVLLPDAAAAVCSRPALAAAPGISGSACGVPQPALAPELEQLLADGHEAYRAGDYVRALALCQPVGNPGGAGKGVNGRTGGRGGRDAVRRQH
jgi:hypothetical protein